MFTGVKFYTSVAFLNTAVVVACHIYSWFLSMWWVLSLSILLSICRVYTYIYVRLIMSSYLLFCISFAMFGISHAVQMKRSFACRVIVEVLVLGLLVVGYFDRAYYGF